MGCYGQLVILQDSRTMTKAFFFKWSRNVIISFYSGCLEIVAGETFVETIGTVDEVTFAEGSSLRSPRIICLLVDADQVPEGHPNTPFSFATKTF